MRAGPVQECRAPAAAVGGIDHVVDLEVGSHPDAAAALVGGGYAGVIYTRAFDAAVAAAYDRGKGISMAEYFEIDDVIDPADTHRWISQLFGDRPDPPRAGKRRPNIDTW